MRRTHPGPYPTVADWVLARVAGDAALEHASRPALDREDQRVFRHISVLLHPGAPGPRAAEEILSAGH